MGDAHAELAHFFQHFFGSVDDRRKHFTGNEVFIPADGRRKQNIINRADA
jgi:hypothetical protein